VPSSFINQNTLTRGRIGALTVNDAPFKLIVNDSSINNPNYVGLTGLQQATNAVMLGVQVDILTSGFISVPNVTLPQDLQAGNISINKLGHVRFFQGNFIYMSKIMGSPNTIFRTF